MNDDHTLAWLLRSRRRQLLLKHFAQPMTAQQLSERVDLSRRDCSDVLAELSNAGLLACLNPKATRSRLYGLTTRGQAVRSDFYPHLRAYQQPAGIDWSLYGFVCFSHRSTVVLSLDLPRSPAEIKRHAKYCNPNIRMSANNVRNVIREFCDMNIVSPVTTRGTYPKYELTEEGRQFQTLLRQAASTLDNDSNQ
jgi:DNA-binding transcriptional regulator GbsR (MarR family)